MISNRALRIPRLSTGLARIHQSAARCSQRVSDNTIPLRRDDRGVYVGMEGRITCRDCNGHRPVPLQARQTGELLLRTYVYAYSVAPRVSIQPFVDAVSNVVFGAAVGIGESATAGEGEYGRGQRHTAIKGWH